MKTITRSTEVIMKKLIITLLSLTLLATAFAGCTQNFDPYANNNQQTTTAATEETKPQETTAPEEEFEDTYGGMVSYMEDKGYLVNDDKSKTEMNADIIGAEKGHRFVKGTASVELYYFNPEKLNDTAKETINSVKKNGYFTVYGENIEATLSKNEKYLMVYFDTAIKGDEENEASKTKAKAIEDFKKF